MFWLDLVFRNIMSPSSQLFPHLIANASYTFLESLSERQLLSHAQCERTDLKLEAMSSAKEYLFV